MAEENRPAGVSSVKRPSIAALLLGLVPFVGMCFTVPLWDRIYPMVLGVPFNFFWLIFWTVITPLFMWGAYRLETRRSEDRDPDSSR